MKFKKWWLKRNWAEILSKVCPVFSLPSGNIQRTENTVTRA